MELDDEPRTLKSRLLHALGLVPGDGIKIDPETLAETTAPAALSVRLGSYDDKNLLKAIFSQTSDSSINELRRPDNFVKLIDFQTFISYYGPTPGVFLVLEFGGEPVGFAVVTRAPDVLAQFCPEGLVSASLGVKRVPVGPGHTVINIVALHVNEANLTDHCDTTLKEWLCHYFEGKADHLVEATPRNQRFITRFYAFDLRKKQRTPSRPITVDPEACNLLSALV